MKKIWVLLTVGVLTTLVVGCTARQQDEEIEKITSLSQILAKTADISQQFQRNELTADEVSSLTRELENKYAQITQNEVKNISSDLKNMQDNVGQQLAEIRKSINTVQEKNVGLPQWAKDLGLTEPQGLSFQKSSSKYTTLKNEGFDSVLLVYTGIYEQSLQEAKRIAGLAKVSVSTEFKAAQSALSGLSAEEISKITSGMSLKGIVYTNHGLLATNIDYLITISVDEYGKLTIEATNYIQMEK